MEELKNNKQFKTLAWIFIIISIIHVVYATITMRGMYMDGGFFMISMLDNMSNNNYDFIYDPGHPRFFIWILNQIPVYFANWALLVNNKFALMMISSFTHFALPLLALFWSWTLCKRNKRSDIFLWNLFAYSAILITFSIFSLVETPLGATFHFILWNYLSSNMEYKRRDYIAIIFLITMMFATYEYVVFLGIIFFFASFHYVFKEKRLKNQLIKTIIGFGSLGASLFNIYMMLKTPGESGEILRFLREAYDFVYPMWNMNLLISIVTILLIGFFILKKNKLNFSNIVFLSCIFAGIFIRLINNLEQSIYPMWETHFRSIPCWLLPLIFLGFYVADLKNKKYPPKVISNLICIVLLCGITQSCWQITSTYYWDKNIHYMKNELNKTDELLYLPAEHELIADFHTPTLRRYIWHGAYAFTSILFSESYEQKTLLVNYDKEQDAGNLTFRERLYILPQDKNYMMIPYGRVIKIKNRFWDLTKCAEALDKYNKENNIQTLE